MLGRCTYESVDGTLKLTVVSGAFEGKSGKKREKLVLQASSTTPPAQAHLLLVETTAPLMYWC